MITRRRSTAVEIRTTMLGGMYLLEVHTKSGDSWEGLSCHSDWFLRVVNTAEVMIVMRQDGAGESLKRP